MISLLRGLNPLKPNMSDRPMPYRKGVQVIVVFGRTGMGVSSLVNLILGREEAPYHCDIHPCTVEPMQYRMEIDGQEFDVYDMPGFRKDFSPAKTIGRLHRERGIDLLVNCIRPKDGTVKGYYNAVRSAVSDRVPIVAVVTGLERHGQNMEDWWLKNGGELLGKGLKFVDHACVTSLSPEDVSYNLDFATTFYRDTCSRIRYTYLYVAQCHADVRPCTQKATSHDATFDDKHFSVYDIPGFVGTSQDDDTIEHIQALEQDQGIDVVVYCLRKKRDTMMPDTLRDIRRVVPRDVPIVAVVTELERQEGHMEDWWATPSTAGKQANGDALGKMGMTFDEHACVTTLSPEEVTRNETFSKRRAHSQDVYLHFSLLSVALPIASRRNSTRSAGSNMEQHLRSHPSRARPVVVVVGPTGVGVSSLVNLMADCTISDQDSNSRRRTRRVIKYSTCIGNAEVSLYEVPGFGGDMEDGVLVKYISALHAHLGIDLLLYCMRKKTTRPWSFRALRETLGEVPIVGVVTELEYVPNKMSDWWDTPSEQGKPTNGEMLERSGMRFHDHVCVTTLPEAAVAHNDVLRKRRDQSGEIMEELVEQYCAGGKKARGCGLVYRRWLAGLRVALRTATSAYY
ncbi:hypothetical protein ID866_7184 [Astraeus odoratus]|nr:hypothetical protein ID866_7184 [Astraeus odoratus]